MLEQAPDEMFDEVCNLSKDNDPDVFALALFAIARALSNNEVVAFFQQDIKELLVRGLSSDQWFTVTGKLYIYVCVCVCVYAYLYVYAYI